MQQFSNRTKTSITFPRIPDVSNILGILRTLRNLSLKMHCDIVPIRFLPTSPIPWETGTNSDQNKLVSPFHGRPQTDKVPIPATYWVHRYHRNDELPCTNRANMKCQTGQSGLIMNPQTSHPSTAACMYNSSDKKLKKRNFHVSKNSNHKTKLKNCLFRLCFQLCKACQRHCMLFPVSQCH